MKKIVCSFLIIILVNIIYLVNFEVFAFNNCLITINVTDLYTLKPINQAIVYVDKIDKYFLTNEKGNTQSISIPFEKNENLDNSLPIQFGEVTIFVYKNGYKDKIRFYENIFNNEKRIISVSLIQGEGIDVESILPPKSYIDNFIFKYKK